MAEVIKISEHPKYSKVYVVELEDGSTRLATKNLTPGKKVYGEWLFKIGEEEYREWNSYRSKLSAALLKGIRELVIKEGMRVLYLGAGSGTTPSHVSDIVGPEGVVYGVEFAPRVVRELLSVAEDRKNLIPILADARFPEKYAYIVDYADVVYADVAQPNQASIVNINAKHFLKAGGYLYLAIKARSIDVTKEPDEIYKSEIKTLEGGGFRILDVVHLDPYDKDHAMVLAQYMK